MLKKNTTGFTAFLPRFVVLVLMTIYIWSIPALFAQDGKRELVQHVNQTVKAGEIFSLIDELSSPNYEGRLTGTIGYNNAATFAANYFKQNSIKPLSKEYYQTFPISYTKIYESTLKIDLTSPDGKKETIAGKYFVNFYPLNFSGSGSVQGEIVFAGFGITAPEFKYDDYKDIDVTGKVVLIIGGVPSKLVKEDWESYEYHNHRTQNARKHGAAALIYIRESAASAYGDYVENFPMVSINKETADKIFANKGLTVTKIKELLDSRKYSSYNTGAQAHVMVKSENSKGVGKNVIAFLPGSDRSLKDEFIVLGAHLDHCGNWPVLTPGAEDNASGSAALLVAARTLSTLKTKPRRSIVFILFGGEEMGLLGSKYFMEHLPAPLTPHNILFFFNMDMVAAGPNIFIQGLKNHAPLTKLMEEGQALLHLQAKVTGSERIPPWRANTDDYPFLNSGIPAVTIF